MKEKKDYKNKDSLSERKNNKKDKSNFNHLFKM